MNRDNNNIESILNLRTNDSIGAELANRQLEVISKAYKYLSTPGTNIIYIADEVGLGKTYIAAGIAMLLRHFSNNVDNHKDVIIVPKKNLQVKWRKELNNFIQYNYLPDNDIIKMQFRSNNSIKDRLVPINQEDPISIFRMTSFSALASARNQNSELFDHLIKDVFKEDSFATTILEKAWHKKYFNRDNQGNLRKVVAYLLNALSPKINCLIIDEAHNYKYGLGHEDHDAAIRNEVTARFLGSKRDSDLLKDFPSLETRVKFPLSEKIICLSATPKDRSLMEIKNQFNCFTNKHILSDSISIDAVKSKLKNFLIRGNLEYNIEDNLVSRNQCRFEHRRGNINKGEKAIPLVIEDSFESIFWQLLQYKSIKHLDTKNNASFEIGMLAGFESYQLDTDKKNATLAEDEGENKTTEKKEYEQTAHRKIKESQDHNVVKKIVDSYKDSFTTDLPPHPKQTKLENEITDQVCRQEKSLIFVRRVATAYELEKRFLDKYEKEIVVKQQLNFSGKYKLYNTPAVQNLLNEYNRKHFTEKLDELFTGLLNKVEIRAYLSAKSIDLKNYETAGKLWLKISFTTFEIFTTMIEKFISEKRRNISQELKDVTINALESTYDNYINHLKEIEENDSEDQEDEESDSGYFFANFFKKGESGFKYRTKTYRETWFEINILLLNNEFGFLEFDDNVLGKVISDKGFDGEKKKHQIFLQQQDTIKAFLISNTTPDNYKPFTQKNVPEVVNQPTFLTDILIQLCPDEMRLWVNKKVKLKSTEAVLKDISILNAIIKNIFRNGSGLLAGFIADSTGTDFSIAMHGLMKEQDAPFHFVLKEIKIIINDFDLLISTNFQERDEKKISTILKNLSPVVGTTGQDKRDRGILAAQFRMPGFPYVLVTTDIFREGEDLHTYCQHIYHYGIAWNPSDMEQRTGRIDRINSLSYRKLNQTNRVIFDNMIQVFYPYLTQSIEVNQVIELLKNIDKFIETFNEIDVENKYETFVRINNEIIESDIPVQITKRLKSLYDVWDFNTQ